MSSQNIAPEKGRVNTFPTEGLKRCYEGLKRCSEASEYGLKLLSAPVNGDDGLGGSPGTTIAGGLIQLEGQGCLAESGAISPAPSLTPCPEVILEYSDLQETLEAGNITATFMVDGVKLQNLLRPKHKYYADKWGSIATIACYEDEDQGKRLLYPKVRAIHRENPYRKMQLRRQTTGRTTKTMLDLVANNELTDFRVADLVFTFPQEVSRFLAGKGKRGREFAWRMEKRLWSELDAVGLHSPSLARSVNLHLWKTENPLYAHFHFHEMVPNYVCTFNEKPRTPVPPLVDWSEDFQTYYRAKHKQYADGILEGTPSETKLRPDEVKFEKRPWDTGADGTGGPWTKDQLRIVKSVWTIVVKRFVRKHNVKCPFFSNPEATLDVHVDFIRLNSEMGRVRFMHKLNYKARHWSEDYAKYSNMHTDCDDPPPWLMKYDNRTRVFGWWGKLKVLAGNSTDSDKDKLSPYTGKTMTYVGRFGGEIGLTSIMQLAEGRLFCVEFIRGRPVETEYTPADLTWLKSVCMGLDDFGGMVHKPPVPVDLQGTLEANSLANGEDFSSWKDSLVVHKGGG